jgi:hypothetical protein
MVALLTMVAIAEAASLVGVGLLVIHLVDHQLSTDSLRELGLSGVGMIGVVAAAALALLWNFFLPLDQSFATAVLAAAGVGFAMSWRAIRQTLSADSIRLLDPAITIAVIVLAGYLSTAQYLSHYDSGLYHIQTLLLNADGPVVLGAASIHMRLGHNSSLYLLADAFNYPVISIGGSVIVNCALIGISVGGIIQLLPLPRPMRRDTIAVTFAVALIAHLLSRPTLSAVTSPQTDLPALFISAFASMLALQIATGRNASDENYTAVRLWLLWVTSILAPTVKLTQLWTPLLAVVATATVAEKKRSFPNAATFGAVAGMGFAAIWSLRGVLLSGCFVYPVSLTCISNLPWAVGPTTAEGELGWITSFGRAPEGASPDAVPAFGEWLRPWFADLMSQAFVQEIEVLLALALAFVVGRLIFRRFVLLAIEQFGLAERVALLAILAIQCIGVVMWFVVAPAPRFGEASLYISASLVLALVFPVRRGAEPSVAAQFAALSLGPIMRRPWIFVAVLLAGALAAEVRGFRNRISSAWPAVPAAPVEEVTTAAGFRYFRPLGDDPESCWAAPRPCTPYSVDAKVHERRFLLWRVLDRG